MRNEGVTALLRILFTVVLSSTPYIGQEMRRVRLEIYYSLNKV